MSFLPNNASNKDTTPSVAERARLERQQREIERQQRQFLESQTAAARKVWRVWKR